MTGGSEHQSTQRELLDVAQRELLSAEEHYAVDWIQDAETLAAHTLYSNVADLVDPKPDETVVDVGTGSALQLLSLVIKCSESNLIGTERTQANVLAAYKCMQDMGIGDHIAVFSDSALESTNDGKAFWRRGSELFRENRDNLRKILQQKILLLDDNILYPQLLQHILPEGRVDAGILSMPGGSSSRIYEWPFTPRDSLTQSHRQQTYDITNATRKAFYRFMAEYIRPEKGRIVVAERMMISSDVDPEAAGIGLIGTQMGDFTKYWEADSGAIVDMDFSSTNVELRGTDAARTMDIGTREGNSHPTKIFMARFNRNDTPFNEPPMEKPLSL